MAPNSSTTKSRSAADGKTMRMLTRVLSAASSSKDQVDTKLTPGPPSRLPPCEKTIRSGFHDFLEDAVVRIIHAIRPAHDVFPLAADAKIHFLNRHRKAARPPPVHDVLGIGHCLPNQFARRIELAGNENFPVGVLHKVLEFRTDERGPAAHEISARELGQLRERLQTLVGQSQFRPVALGK